MQSQISFSDLLNNDLVRLNNKEKMYYYFGMTIWSIFNMKGISVEDRDELCKQCKDVLDYHIVRG